MNDRIEVKGLFGSRWRFRAVGRGRGLAIQAYKRDNKGDNPDVNVGLSVNQAKELRDFLVEKYGPGEGYVKVGEGMVNATAEELPERRFKVGDRVQVKAGDQEIGARLKPDSTWVGRAGTVVKVDPEDTRYKYAYEVRMDGDNSGMPLSLFGDEVEPEVTWKYKVGDKVQVNTKAPELLRGIAGEVTATSDHPSVLPGSPWAYTIRHETTGKEYTFSELELDPYVEPTLGDQLAPLPVGTVIHFDRDPARFTWVKRSDCWYSTMNDIKLVSLLGFRASGCPFKVIYNPETDN